MTALEETLARLAELLTEHGVPYMVIGGVANAVWGVPRATLDIDVTLWVPEPGIEAVIDWLAEHHTPLVDDPRAFVARTRVLPLSSSVGVRIDVIFGQLPFEEEAVRRARTKRVAGVDVRFCTPEDLILHKILSERPRDREDARGIALRRFGELDLAYLEPRVHELSALLERPDIREQWDDWKKEAAAK